MGGHRVEQSTMIKTEFVIHCDKLTIKLSGQKKQIIFSYQQLLTKLELAETQDPRPETRDPRPETRDPSSFVA